ncbi:tyrosine--tRNA ligase [Patescibacteria group bacterium]|nr:tyrosine--tRNA ligase [Nanoarchaeota archaeon]MBU1682674.1 tyrosine--tRNA ligase [Patescibacteria group bacterium]
MDNKELLTRGVECIVPKAGLMEKIKSGKKLRVYLGIDPTSTQISLGNAVPLRKLRDFQNAGHEVIFLVGSFTALIGDTSDKDAMRKPMTPAEIEHNFHTYKEQASKILDFDKSKIMYNGDWLSNLSFQNIVELAQHFTVQQMIERDMYQLRLEAGKPIGLHEFLYPLMQGYDSVHMEVDLEIGGNDQLFNMLAGRTLLKAYKNKEKHVLCTPLIEGLDGRKMSKSYGNTIDIMDEPSDMFGKVMSMTDDLIIKYMILCTDMPIKEIDEIDKGLKAGDNPRDAKVRLAREIVTLYHDQTAATKAEEEFVNVFKKGGVPDDMPEFKINGDRSIIDLLELCKLIESRAEGKRLIKQGGVKINDKKVDDMNEVIHLEKDMIVQVGKRRFAKIV